MHKFIQNNNKNTHATHTGKTHKNKRINNNATCNLTHNYTYLGKNITNYMQTFHEPPILRPHCSSLSAVGHPQAGTKLHSSKAIPNQIDISQTT